MFGRLVGLVIGLAIAATGFGLYKPLVAAKYETFVDFTRLPLGPFDQYRTIVAFLVMALGIVVALASLQRETSRKSTRPVLTMLGGDEEPSDDHAPASDHHGADHDDHGHDDPEHDAHGHDAHGHDAHGHDGHGHDDHAHDDHGREKAHHH